MFCSNTTFLIKQSWSRLLKPQLCPHTYSQYPFFSSILIAFVNFKKVYNLFHLLDPTEDHENVPKDSCSTRRKGCGCPSHCLEQSCPGEPPDQHECIGLYRSKDRLLPGGTSPIKRSTGYCFHLALPSLQYIFHCSAIISKVNSVMHRKKKVTIASIAPSNQREEET